LKKEKNHYLNKNSEENSKIIKSQKDELFRKNKVLDELMRLVYGESWKSEKYVN